MDSWWSGLWQDLSTIENPAEFVRLAGRLLASALVGGIVGFERETSGQSAGLRTHMLVALGATFFVLAPIQAGMQIDHLSRVLEGVIAGIGFLGAGAILKQHDAQEVKGLTTAANIWMTAALGAAIGLGQITLAFICCAIVLIVLTALRAVERAIGTENDKG